MSSRLQCALRRSRRGQNRERRARRGERLESEVTALTWARPGEWLVNECRTGVAESPQRDCATPDRKLGGFVGERG
jgi:hypothetical protein